MFARLARLLPVLAAATLAGCAAPVTHQELMPIAVDVARPHPQSVSVTALPKTGDDAASVAELRTALDEALAGYKVFAQVKPAGGAYQLTVQVAGIDTPALGISFTSNVVLDWTLKRADTGAVVWQESIKSAHTTGGDENFVAAERRKMAFAGALRRNIAMGLQRIGALSL